MPARADSRARAGVTPPRRCRRPRRSCRGRTATTSTGCGAWRSPGGDLPPLVRPRVRWASTSSSCSRASSTPRCCCAAPKTRRGSRSGGSCADRAASAPSPRRRADRDRRRTVATRPFTQWSATADQVLASLLHVQNWQLARSAADYQAADASVSPMQHLWSMSVQAQFYLVMIALVAVALHRADGLTGRAGFRLSARSRSSCSAWRRSGTRQANRRPTRRGRTTTPSRGCGSRWQARYWRWWPHAWRCRGPVRSVLAVAGLAAILSCGFLIDGARLFPGPAALVPVLATLALIVAGAGGGRMPTVSRMLGGAGFVWLGSIAYGLYLGTGRYSSSTCRGRSSSPPDSSVASSCSACRCCSPGPLTPGWRRRYANAKDPPRRVGSPR